jgi:hypothetical protein
MSIEETLLGSDILSFSISPFLSPLFKNSASLQKYKGVIHLFFVSYLVLIFFIAIFFCFEFFFYWFFFSILSFSIWFHLIFISDLILMILIAFFYPFIIIIFQSHPSTFCFILFFILNLVLIILIAIYFVLNPFFYWILFFNFVSHYLIDLRFYFVIFSGLIFMGLVAASWLELWVLKINLSCLRSFLYLF